MLSFILSHSSLSPSRITFKSAKHPQFFHISPGNCSIMARLSIGIVCFLSWASAEYTAPSADQVNAIKDIIKAALKEDKDYLPTVVRLGNYCLLE